MSTGENIRPNLKVPHGFPVRRSGSFALTGNLYVKDGDNITPIDFKTSFEYCRQTASYDIGRVIINKVLFKNTEPRYHYSKSVVPEKKSPPAILLGPDHFPETDPGLVISHKIIVDPTSSNYDKSVGLLISATDEDKTHKIENILNAVFLLFGRLVHGKTFDASPCGVTATRTEEEHRKYNGDRLRYGYLFIDVHTTTAFLATQRLLHGALGVVRDCIDFISVGYSFEDLLPSYGYVDVCAATKTDDIAVVREMFLQVVDSLELFRSSRTNTPSSRNSAHQLRFVAKRAMGVNTFLPNAGVMKPVLVENFPGTDGMMPNPYYKGENVVTKYNILPAWTNQDLGVSGWWESGQENVFRKGLRPEYAQFLKDTGSSHIDEDALYEEEDFWDEDVEDDFDDMDDDDSF